jgi:hypothetical protein
LIALDPTKGSGPIGKTFEPDAWAAMQSWIDTWNGRRNLYFSVNEPVAGAPDTKLSREHIGRIRALFADSDFRQEDHDSEFRRIVEHVRECLDGRLPPSLAIFTGGGCQFFWRLKEKLDPAEHESWAKNQGRGVASLLGGDRVQNIDRIMRLPGTLNIPDARKIEKGRIPRVAYVFHESDRTYTPEDVQKHVQPIHKAAGKTTADNGRARTGPLRPEEAVTREIMRRRAEWIPQVVPCTLGKPDDEWRVTSEELERNLEEDLSIYPDGIYDHGTERSHTPLSLICEFGTVDAAGDISFGGCPDWPARQSTVRGYRGARHRRAATDRSRSAHMAVPPACRAKVSHLPRRCHLEGFGQANRNRCRARLGCLGDGRSVASLRADR